MLNSNIQSKKVPMYREPHLQRKSDQCAYLWKNWYNYKYGLGMKKRQRSVENSGGSV